MTKLLNSRYIIITGILLILLSVTIYAEEADTRDGDRPGSFNDHISTDLFRHHGTPMLIIETEEGLIVSANDAAVAFYGFEEDELTGMRISDINTLTPEEVSVEMQDAASEMRNYFVFKHRLADGTIRDVEVYSYPFESSSKQYLYSIIIDITEETTAQANYRQAVYTHYIASAFLIAALLIATFFLFSSLKNRRHILEQLELSEEGYENLFDNMHEGYALHEIITDDMGQPVDYRFLKVNRSFEIFTGLKAEDLIGRTVLEALPETEPYWIESYGKVALEGETMNIENYAQELNRYYSVNVYNAGYGKFITVFIDVTDAKEKEIEINYLSYHDQLTGLYNRHYIERKLIEEDIPPNLPLSIIMADVNGLKMANDAFGHELGDQLLEETSRIFRSTFRESDIISRIGGDEFLILLSGTAHETVKTMAQRLKDNSDVITVGPIRLSVSLGFATKTHVSEDLHEVSKRAEDMMYRNKLTESHRTRLHMIEHIFDQIAHDYSLVADHQKRVGMLADMSQDWFGLSHTDHEQLIEAALRHDTGLVAIDYASLSKPGILNDQEWTEVYRHSECGYRILSGVAEYAGIADIVLAHHERFDGTGYPKGLIGDEIPYLARILSVFDAYDAMTHDRLYNKTFTYEEAIEELRANAGTQFDPELVDKFIEGYDGSSHI